MHKTWWKCIDLPPRLKKAIEEQERLNKEKNNEDAAEKNSKFMTAEEYMKQDLEN